MQAILGWVLGTMGPWIALKLLKPERVAQLGYDIVSHWTKKTPSPDDDAFLDHVADFLELKK